jgi:hypothetical protein
VVAKVPVDHRNHHLVAKFGLGTGPASFDLAVFGATVAGVGVAVITLLRRNDETVAAFRGARTTSAVGFDLAILGTAIERHCVAVVAALRTLDFSVATDGRGANARAAAALVANLNFASRRAAVAGKGVPVITLLRQDRDAVAATVGDIDRIYCGCIGW